MGLRIGPAMAGLALLATTTGWSALAQEGGRAAPGSTRAATGYHQDPRFTAKVPLGERLLTLGPLLVEISDDVHAQLLTPAGWSKRPVGVAARELRACDLMDSLESAFGGRWFFIAEQQAWVLSRTQGEARVAAREVEQRRSGGPTLDYIREASRRLERLARSFSPSQWSRLEAGEKLSASDLSGQQWGMLRDAMLTYMRDPTGPHPYTPRPVALDGQAQLWLKQGPDGEGAQLRFAWPGPDPAYDGLDVTGVLVRRNPEGQWSPTNLPPSLPPGAAADPRPGEASAPPSSPADPDYRKDPRLKAKLPGTDPTGTWEELLKAWEGSVKAPVLMQGDWLAKPLPFSARGRSAVEVMEKISRFSGRPWERSGDVWVLAPRRQ